MPASTCRCPKRPTRSAENRTARCAVHARSTGEAPQLPPGWPLPSSHGGHQVLHHSLHAHGQPPARRMDDVRRLCRAGPAGKQPYQRALSQGFVDHPARLQRETRAGVDGVQQRDGAVDPVTSGQIPTKRSSSSSSERLPSSTARTNAPIDCFEPIHPTSRCRRRRFWRKPGANSIAARLHSQRAAASAVSSGDVLKAIAAPGAAR
jgi:hypothetical protein